MVLEKDNSGYLISNRQEGDLK